MSELPISWAVASVDDCVVERRAGYWGAGEPTPERPNLVKVIRNGDIAAGKIGSWADRYFSDAEVERSAVNPGDVLMTTSGQIGKSAMGVAGFCASNFVRLLRPEPEFVDGRYLRYALMTQTARDALVAWSGGSTIQNLRTAFFGEPILRLAPWDEQRRIVASIEEYLSRLDAAEASLAIALQRLAGLRRGALVDHFNGSWPTVELRQATDAVRPICYGILKPKTTGQLEVPYIEVRSIKNGVVDLASLHCTTRALHEEFRRSELRGGDVVLAIRGSFDRAAVVPPVLEGANVSRDVARIAPLPELDPQYLAHYLSGPAAFRYFAGAARGVGVRGVNIGDLRTMPIPLPPLEEQRRIVEEVESRLSAIDALRAAIERAQRRSGSLRRAVLERAFRGELVPQDRTDEPVSELLERIRAEREAAPPKLRRRGVKA